MKLTPDDPNVQYHLAYALLQTSRKDEAVAMLKTITAAHPDHAQAQYQLGKALVDAGQYQEAIEHLEAAAKYDPNHDYIHYQLQAAYRKVGRTADADRELAVYKQIKEQQRDKGNPQPKPIAWAEVTMPERGQCGCFPWPTPAPALLAMPGRE